MATELQTQLDIPPELLDAIEETGTDRLVEHCGESWSTSPFALYVTCPKCRQKVKVRGFSGEIELEDVFDAVFRWMASPAGRAAAESRIEAIRSDDN